MKKMCLLRNIKNNKKIVKLNGVFALLGILWAGEKYPLGSLRFEPADWSIVIGHIYNTPQDRPW